MGDRVVLRGHPGDRLEDAMEIAGAEAGGRGQVRERRDILRPLDQPADARHRFGVLDIGRRLVGLATLAGVKAGCLRVLDRVVKAHVPGVGCPGGAGRAAIDPGGRHRIPKRPIGGLVAPDHTRPARIALCGCVLRSVGHECGHRRSFSGFLYLRHKMAVPDATGTPALAFKSK